MCEAHEKVIGLKPGVRPEIRELMDEGYKLWVELHGLLGKHVRDNKDRERMARIVDDLQGNINSQNFQDFRFLYFALKRSFPDQIEAIRQAYRESVFDGDSCEPYDWYKFEKNERYG
jgi:hypothetical protein